MLEDMSDAKFEEIPLRCAILQLQEALLIYGCAALLIEHGKEPTFKIMVGRELNNLIGAEAIAKEIKRGVDASSESNQS